MDKKKGKIFTVATCSNWKALETGAECLISEAFLYLSGAIHLIGWFIIGKIITVCVWFTFLLFSCWRVSLEMK